MESKYQPLQEMPYTDSPPQIPPVTLEPNYQRVTINTHDISRTQVGPCCMCCAVCNYIWCPRLGIPALIFAILGQEADKRRDFEAAKSHAYHAKVFNIIWLILLIINLLFVVGFVVLVIYFTSYLLAAVSQLERQIANLPTSQTY